MTPLDAISVPLRGANLIEASAGTGKTYAITSLYVRLLLELQLSVGEILVVTYTNAATAELRARLRRRLREALAAFEAGGCPGDEFLDRLVRKRREEQPAEQDCAQLVVALHSFDEAAIFTIHSFCQRMLQENAFESGVAFDTELISNQGPLLSEVVQDFWVRELHAAPDTFVRQLEENKITPEILQRLAVKTITHPDMTVLPARNAADPRKLEDALGNGKTSGDAAEAELLNFQLDLVDYARSELRRRKDRARLKSFDDLLQRLAEALRSPSGQMLASMVRQRFPAALIDEFQDTDPVQYEIFRRVYLGTDAILFLIGDPKQAIYAFRGADVFAYMEAKRDAGGVPHTLLINWRSDPSLVRAVNTLFTRLKLPFVFDDIPFHRGEAAPNAADRLGGAAVGQPPLQIIFVRRTGQQGKGGFINKSWGEDQLTRAMAAEVVRFLHSGATLGGRPVEPGDIAVLCRKNKQASLMQQALRRLSVPSVLQTEASVFEAPEAGEVERVLRAMADPADSRAIRAALSTVLMGQNAHRLCNLEHDEQEWDAWVREFQAWHDLWTQRSFVAAFRALLDSQSVQQRLLGLFDGERRLTNVLHLMELLHAASTEERRGPHALVRWLHQMRTDIDARAELAGEAAQIRLESDEAAVKLTTVHKSKGLQYPIVYCPYLWDGSLLFRDDERTVLFHDPDDSNRLKLDIGSTCKEDHVELAKREVFAENLRLLYVALTRARHRCTVVWGPFRSAESSALGYVLHQPASVKGDPRASVTDRIKSFVSSRDDSTMRGDLEAIAAAAPGCIQVTDLSPDAVGRYSPPGEEERKLRCRTATRQLRRTWRVSSFSALASSGGAISQPAEEGLDHDATAKIVPGDDLPIGPPAAPVVILHDFPAGARAGQLIHEVLECLDFQAGDASVLQDTTLKLLARFGFEDKWAEPLCRAIADLVATPLGDGAEQLCLQEVPPSRRLNELEFTLPVAAGWAATPSGVSPTPAAEAAALLTAARLADVFEHHAAAPLPSEYAQQVRRLGFGPLAGFLRGFIDLVFEHGGRWHLVDYKSNLLGLSPEHYKPSRLLAAMREHHYFLQYHLYVVALHRYLSARLTGYDYERDFGGVYYLFLRGMAPHYRHGNGVFFDRPSPLLIEKLSAVLEGDPEAAS